MKLKNKKTGKEGELVYFVSINLAEFETYKSLSELKKDWEIAEDEE